MFSVRSSKNTLLNKDFKSLVWVVVCKRVKSTTVYVNLRNVNGIRILTVCKSACLQMENAPMEFAKAKSWWQFLRSLWFKQWWDSGQLLETAAVWDTVVCLFIASNSRLCTLSCPWNNTYDLSKQTVPSSGLLNLNFVLQLIWGCAVGILAASAMWHSPPICWGISCFFLFLRGNQITSSSTKKCRRY